VIEITTLEDELAAYEQMIERSKTIRRPPDHRPSDFEADAYAEAEAERRQLEADYENRRRQDGGW
jgi:hypothetical protein